MPLFLIGIDDPFVFFILFRYTNFITFSVVIVYFLVYFLILLLFYKIIRGSFDVKQLNSSNIRSIASYVTKNNAKFRCQVWNCSKRISELYTDFYTTTEFLDNFKRLNAVMKEFEVKDHIERPFLNIKMIDLNRQTLPLYRRLDEKNKTI